MKRREFIVKTALGTAAATLPFSRELFAEAKNDPQKPLDIAAIFGGTAAEMFERGIAEMGGMGRFRKKGRLCRHQAKHRLGPTAGSRRQHGP